MCNVTCICQMGLPCSSSGSDSDEEALLTGAEERRASAALLRFKLRRWDRSFLAQHGRKATYEDRKLDRGYQELRARLRAVDTEHEREKDRVPLKPRRCLSPMASTRRSSAARATGLRRLVLDSP